MTSQLRAVIRELFRPLARCFGATRSCGRRDLAVGLAPREQKSARVTPYEIASKGGIGLRPQPCSCQSAKSTAFRADLNSLAGAFSYPL